MPTTESTLPLDTVQDALDVIATASTLGLTFPTPAGMTVWVFTQGEEDHSWVDLTVFPTEAAAITGLAQKLLWEWAGEGKIRLPWDDEEADNDTSSSQNSMERAKDWLTKHTAQDFIDIYHDTFPECYYTIREETVKEANTRLTYSESLDAHYQARRTAQ